MGGNWRPLEEKLEPAQCVGLVLMRSLNRGNLYKHGLSWRYRKLGDAYEHFDRGRFAESPFEQALSWAVEPLAAMGKTLETPYDEEYKARRSALLCTAGWTELRMQVQPQG